MAFCSNCGAQLNDGAKFCTSCGAAVEESQPQPPAQTYQAPAQTSQAPAYQQAFYEQRQQQAQQQPQPSQYVQPQYVQPQYGQPAAVGGDPKYQTLGGWLLFFVIAYGLGALSGVGTILDGLGSLGTAMSYGAGVAMPLIVGILANVLAVSTDTVAIVMIVKRNPLFLRLLQILTSASIVLSVLSAAISTSIIADSALAAVGAAIGGIIGGVVGLCLTTLYFCKSVRVRTYMGSRAYLDQALFRLGAN